MTQPNPSGESTGGKILAGALGGVAGGGLVDKAGGVISSIPGASQLGDITDTARAVRAWVSTRHNWVRVSWFLSGALMFAVGAVMLGERPVSAGVKGVTAPVGSVVKSVYK